MPARSHGLSKHPLYRTWQDIKRRCYDPAFRPYPYYGGVGVTMCKEWLVSPKEFINWALDNGWQPGMEIDKDLKVKGNKVYSPATCSVVSHRVNMLSVVSRQSGRKSSKLKLSCEDVAHIVRAKKRGVTTRELSLSYGVDISTINRVYRKTKG